MLIWKHAFNTHPHKVFFLSKHSVRAWRKTSVLRHANETSPRQKKGAPTKNLHTEPPHSKKTKGNLLHAHKRLGVSIFDPTREHDTGFFGLGLGLNGFGS